MVSILGIMVISETYKDQKMDLLELALEENELNNDSNDIFFKRLADYIKDKGGSVAENKLEFHQDNQCLQITRDKSRVVFELIEDDK